MATDPTAGKQPDKNVEIDEQFLSEWVGFGLTEFGVLLEKYAAFADYLDHREEPA